jgi:RNA polymerase sigma-70 factor (ECF subfamily)
LQLTRNPAEAEDLVQDTLIRALRFWGSYNPEQAIKPWLFTVLRNTFHNRCESKGRRTEVHTAYKGDAVALLGDAAPVVENVLVAAEVREAIEALPAEFCEVIRLVDLQGLGYVEAADLLGVPKGTVMSRLHRGRKRLKGLLAEVA